MKLALLILIVALFRATAPAQTPQPLPKLRISTDSKSTLRNIVARARRLDRVDYRVGFANVPGEFHNIVEACLWVGDREDFEAQLNDQNPIVRILGLVCLARVLDSKQFKEVTSRLFTDFETVRYTNGCVETTATVERIAHQLADDNFFTSIDRRPVYE